MFFRDGFFLRELGFFFREMFVGAKGWIFRKDNHR
jgi:hypothetical protein